MHVIIDRVLGSRVIAGIGLRPAHGNPGLWMLWSTADDGLADPGDLPFLRRDSIGNTTNNGYELLVADIDISCLAVIRWLARLVTEDRACDMGLRRSGGVN